MSLHPHNFKNWRMRVLTLIKLGDLCIYCNKRGGISFKGGGLKEGEDSERRRIAVIISNLRGRCIYLNGKSQKI